MFQQKQYCWFQHQTAIDSVKIVYDTHFATSGTDPRSLQSRIGGGKDIR